MVRRSGDVTNVKTYIGEQEQSCPFCGSRKVTIEEKDGICFYLCDDCGAVISFQGSEEKEDAARCWNRRAS
ncbi:MAG: Lar family restriction alleviation protein [Flexilinea sp.]|nr:Lar family restriction alleviation protein [Flexilinea sp.]